jgi:hypothetical protein
VSHEIAQRYKEILAGEALMVEERFTDGSLDNAHCCSTPNREWISRSYRAVPASFASEAHTLREDIGLVRRAVMAKAANAGAGPIEKPPPNSAPA